MEVDGGLGGGDKGGKSRTTINSINNKIFFKKDFKCTNIPRRKRYIAKSYAACSAKELQIILIVNLYWFVFLASKVNM